MTENGIPKSAPFHLTAVDQEVLRTADKDFHLQTWDDLKIIIANNRLELLKRLPSDLKRYISWTNEIRAKYGSTTAYLLQERLQWTPLPSTDPQAAPRFTYNSLTPFADPSDYKILKNDWPYGLAPGIVHICVWLRTPIPVTPDTGDVTEASRQLIEEFVDREFREKLRVWARENFGEEKGEEWVRDRVMWFKNWTMLQSIRGVDHVHVLLRDAPEELLRQWMN